jgi:Lrp/AsnC family transcriptional regulator
MVEKHSLDPFDRKILALLQQDSTLSLAEIAERVGLSSTPCWRRIQKLEQAGVIRRRVALLEPQALGLGLTAFVSIRTGQHDPDWLEGFMQATVAMPEVVEIDRLAGSWDYQLRVVVPDIAAYDAFYKRLIAIGGLSDVQSAFSMEQIKYTTELPLGPDSGG